MPLSVKESLTTIVAGLALTVFGVYFFWQECILRNITTSVGWFPGFVWEPIAVISGLVLTLSGILNLIDAMRWRARGMSRRRIWLIAFVLACLGGSFLPVFSRILEIPYQEEVSYTVEVPYNVTIETTVEVEDEIIVEYGVLVPVVITESVPVRITEEVLKENVIREYHKASVPFLYGDEKNVELYSIPVYEARDYLIEWSTDEELPALAIVNMNSALTIFDRISSWEFFTVIMTNFRDDGTVYHKSFFVESPSTAASEIMRSEGLCEYAAFSSMEGSGQVYLDATEHALLYVTNAPPNLGIKIFYEYYQTETRTVYEEQSVTIYEEQIAYRNETIIRYEIQYDTITEYREEIRYRMEDRIRIVEEKFSLASLIFDFLEKL